MKKIPIADCPRCGRIILYSSNPADKKLYKTELAAEDYVGRFAQCNKCKSVVAIVDAVCSLAEDTKSFSSSAVAICQLIVSCPLGCESEIKGEHQI